MHKDTHIHKHEAHLRERINYERKLFLSILIHSRHRAGFSRSVTDFTLASASVGKREGKAVKGKKTERNNIVVTIID